MELKTFPIWTSWVFGEYDLLTWKTTIYHSKDLNPGDEFWIPFIAHELIHVRQWAEDPHFLRNYVLRPSYRLNAEAEAFATECGYYYGEQRDNNIRLAAEALSGPNYFWAASSVEEAERAIRTWITKLEAEK